MAGISTSLSGELELARVDSEGCPVQSSAQLFSLELVQFGGALSGLAASDGTFIGQSCLSINSPAAFVTLPFPTGFQARMVYLRALSGGPFDVRLTHTTAGAVTHPDVFLTLQQYDPTDEVITLMEVQGVGAFEWVAVGLTT